MEDNQETAATRFHGFKDYEIARLDRDITWMRQGDTNNIHKADFYKFFNEADRRHKTNFLEVFPEMTQWWGECKYYANQS